MKVINRKFFERKATKVAPGLLGKFLCRYYPPTRNRPGQGGKVIRAVITETEAYDGFRDKASHAHRGETPRNKVMFGPPGRWYVYFVYGNHWMLNIVTGKKGYPAAVLIRGIALDTDLHGFENRLTRIINGPGRVTKFLKIDKKFNGKSATRLSGLWIEENPKFKNLKLKIKNSPRVGVSYAGEWARKRWRFYT